MEIQERIRKDLDKFNESLRKIDTVALNEKESGIIEMAKLYARDSAAFEEKMDYYTSFASISYAHGLLDAVLKLHAE